MKKMLKKLKRLPTDFISVISFSWYIYDTYLLKLFLKRNWTHLLQNIQIVQHINDPQLCRNDILRKVFIQEQIAFDKCNGINVMNSISKCQLVHYDTFYINDE